MRRVLLALALAAPLVACTEYPKLTGTFNGAEFVVRSAFVLKSFKGGKTGTNEEMKVFVVFSDHEDLCARLDQGKMPPGGSILKVRPFVAANGTESVPIGPGEYYVEGSGDGAGETGAEFNKKVDGKISVANAGSCDDVVSDADGKLKSGRLLLTAFSLGGPTAGTLDVTFGNGDKLAGDFNVTVCDIAYSEAEPLACSDD